VIGPNAPTPDEAVRKWNELPRREDAQQVTIAGPFQNPQIIDDVIARWNGSSFPKVEPLTSMLTWDARVGGHNWHTVFIFDGPRTYVVASCDKYSSFCGQSNCNPKDEYNRNTGMREAVRSMMLNYVGKWRSVYQRAFRVWVNQFYPVWPKG
jgi:hypothetical protein